MTYSCKFAETSALMNMKVDELLAGVLNQIRLRKHKQSKETPDSATHCSLRSPIALLGRVLKPAVLRRQFSKSCDNLLVL